MQMSCTDTIEKFQLSIEKLFTLVYPRLALENSSYVLATHRGFRSDLEWIVQIAKYPSQASQSKKDCINAVL